MHEPGPPPDPSAEPAPTPVGAKAHPHIPGYTINKRIGRGGMATVYLATQQSLDRSVAIKVMEPEALRDEVSKQRFENEARTIARLAHPGIVGIHQVGRTDEGQMYYVMPYLANGDLSRRDLRGDEARIAALLRTLLSALAHAHARGIVHRDVKRENVLFDAEDRPMLTDFGIATSPGPDTSRLTSAGTALGSSGYMAPEQARGAAVDARADLYSVGVLAYELLTGHLPYQSQDALALALMHAQDPIPRLPPEREHWQAFVYRAMAKAPDQRFANAQQMLDALERIPLGGAVAPARARLSPRVLLAAAALVLLVVIGFAVRALRAPDAAAPPVATTDAADTADTAAPPADAATPPATTEPTTTQPASTEAATTQAPTTPAPAKSTPAKSTPPPPDKHTTLAQRARNTKEKVKRWFRRH
jgi:tRNA A-37 threonylcarbamoyl transferase component Bud32